MPASKRAIERHPRRCLDCSAGSQRRCQPALPPADKRYLTDDLCGSHSRDLTLAPVANGHWPFRCIKRYTSYTRGVKEFQSYTAKTALYSAIQRYTVYSYTALYTIQPLHHPSVLATFLAESLSLSSTMTLPRKTLATTTRRAPNTKYIYHKKQTTTSPNCGNSNNCYFVLNTQPRRSTLQPPHPTEP